MKVFMILQGENNSINIVLGLHHLNLPKPSKSFILYFICWPSASGFPTWEISSLWSICHHFGKRWWLDPQESLMHCVPDRCVSSMPVYRGICHYDLAFCFLTYLSFWGCVFEKVSAFQYADGVILLIYFPLSSDIEEPSKENYTLCSSLSFTIHLKTSKQAPIKNENLPHSTLRWFLIMKCGL